MIKKCIESVTSFFNEVLDQECRVYTCIPEKDKWKVECEVLIDPNYTRKRALGELVELYEVYLNEQFEVISYQLKGTKKRGSIKSD